jgi:hypothetical protein
MLKLRNDPSTRRRGTVAAVATAAVLATLVSAAPSAVATPSDVDNVDAKPWPDFPLRETAVVHPDTSSL